MNKSIFELIPFTPQPPPELKVHKHFAPAIINNSVFGGYLLEVLGLPVTFSYRFPVPHNFDLSSFQEVWLTWELTYNNPDGSLNVSSIERRTRVYSTPDEPLRLEILNGFYRLFNSVLKEILDK